MTVDKKLMESVLGEEWALDPEATSPFEKSKLELDGRYICDFWESDDDAKDNERARQAALGHRALRYLARMHEASENDTLHLKVDELSEEERAIVRELRGEL